MLAHSSISTKLRALFAIAGNRHVPIYVLIDEYDNLANAVLARDGEAAYHALTRDDGFYRSFFAALKAGTNVGAMERLFVTGVSPLAMDDLTSGFNIARNLSLRPEFNAMLGFTENEVRGLLRDYDAKAPPERFEDALAIMRKWYNGYRFATKAQEDVYNTDLVLYYLAECRDAEAPPRRADRRQRARGLWQAAASAHRRRTSQRQLRSVAHGDGQGSRRVSRAAQLPASRTSTARQLPLAAALLRPAEHPRHGIGKARTRGAESDRPAAAAQLPARRLPGRRRVRRGLGRLGAPDATDGATRRVAAGAGLPGRGRSARRPACATTCAKRRWCQGFLAAYLGATDHFLFSTEREFAKGFVDICLEPFAAHHPQARHGYLIELKYVKRDGDEAKVDAALADAKAQLARYLTDETLARQRHDLAYTGLAVVFRGWELAHCEAVPWAVA